MMNHVVHIQSAHFALWKRQSVTPPVLTPPRRLLPGGWEGKVLYVDSMNHVIHDIETPPGLTPPRLLAGCWEGKVLYVESQHYVIYEPRDSSY